MKKININKLCEAGKFTVAGIVAGAFCIAFAIVYTLVRLIKKPS